MWFRRSTDSVLNEPRRVSTADYLCKLMEEQNNLLRELLRATGRQPATIKASPVTTHRIRTEKDVFRVDRETILKQEQAEAEKISAPWRNGRDSDVTASTSGHTPTAQGSAPEGSDLKPFVPSPNKILTTRDQF